MRRGRLTDGALVASTMVLALLAARAGLNASGVERWQVAADLLVGIAFVVAGRFSPVPVLAGALMVAVGAAWLLGSFVSDARLWHQSVLTVALVTFPTGWPGWLGQRLVAAVAIVVLVFQPTSSVIPAAMFGMVVVAVVLEPRGDRTGRGFAAIAAALTGIVLCGSWYVARSSPESYDPVVALSIYEGTLIAIAASASFAARAVVDRRARLVDQFLTDERLVGIGGLEAVLGDALGDATVRVHRRPPRDGGIRPDGPPPGRRWMPVSDRGVPLAVVELGSNALDDPATAAAVASAVRLALTNFNLQDELDDQLAALEAARGRLVAAGDRQRESTVYRLRRDVLEPLDYGVGELRALATAVSDPEAAEALTVVVGELTAAAAEIGDHVAGVPGTQFGGGRLVAALDALVSGLPLPVHVEVPDGWSAAPAAEAALFYACSEAVTNAIKHSRATHVSVALQRTGGVARLTVTDDGIGGADVDGSGLVGLADRLAARGGRLEVESPPGAGTTLTATVIG